MREQDKIVKFFLDNGRNFGLTRNKFNLRTLTLHLILAKSKVLSIEEKIEYGPKNNQIGAKAEKLFKELVPEAIDCNNLKKNNQEYDFLYKNLTIDIKYSSLAKRNKNGYYWHCRLTQNPDIFILFLERNMGDKIKNPYIIIIPSALKQSNTISITKSGVWFNEFRVETFELVEILNEYSELKILGEETYESIKEL